jgi:hypothetical protein
MGATPILESSKFSIINRDAILAELLELEGMLQDDRFSDYDHIALHGAQQTQRHVLEPDTLAASVLQDRQSPKRRPYVLPKLRRLALDAQARVARTGRVEPHARRTSHGGL